MRSWRAERIVIEGVCRVRFLSTVLTATAVLLSFDSPCRCHGCGAELGSQEAAVLLPKQRGGGRLMLLRGGGAGKREEPGSRGGPSLGQGQPQVRRHATHMGIRGIAEDRSMARGESRSVPDSGIQRLPSNAGISSPDRGSDDVKQAAHTRPVDVGVAPAKYRNEDHHQHGLLEASHAKEEPAMPAVELAQRSDIFLDDMDGTFDVEFHKLARGVVADDGGKSGDVGTEKGSKVAGAGASMAMEARSPDGISLRVQGSHLDPAAASLLEAVELRLSAGDVDGAEAALITALREQPSADETALYAAFLWHVRGDLEGADTLSLAALDVQGSLDAAGKAKTGTGVVGARETASLTALKTRAHVLKYIKADSQGAYQMYERAMRAYAGHAGTYYDAALLHHPGAALDVTWEDARRAEELYRKAIAIDEVSGGGCRVACEPRRLVRATTRATTSIILI